MTWVEMPLGITIIAFSSSNIIPYPYDDQRKEQAATPGSHKSTVEGFSLSAFDLIITS